MHQPHLLGDGFFRNANAAVTEIETLVARVIIGVASLKLIIDKFLRK
jgi:hypothetical protein